MAVEERTMERSGKYVKMYHLLSDSVSKAGIFLTFGVTLYALFEIMYQRGFDTDGRLVMSWY
jgi:formate hydrogenlyase subunit 3/multisubunit Na+/H+ antiporter MnhD subunit